jgi:membrane protease YdiL (CAAX protease family)
MGVFVRKRPILFTLILTVAWFALLMIFMGIASAVFKTSYGDAISSTIGHAAAAVCIIIVIWRLDILKASGIARLGRWQIWLLALLGMIYFVCASLYAFYGKAGFNFSGLLQEPNAFSSILTHFTVSLNEEFLFRGLILTIFIRAWAHNNRGKITSVLITSVLFAGVHLTQVFTHGLPLSSVLLLTLETLIISIWWGALVVLGESIWPAVLLHFVVNAAVSVQGYRISLLAPEILAYRRILWFSIPLGILGMVLLFYTARKTG